MNKLLPLLFLLAYTTATAQTKKPLSHSVYDGWKSVGERAISNNGKYAVYAINPQEGDGMLVIHDLQNGKKQEAERGYAAIFSQDNKYVFYKIKPRYAETRQAKIKKKKVDEMPKDSFAIVLLGTDSIIKLPLVKSFKAPEKGSGWLAYLAEKPIVDATKKKTDSLKIKIDGLAKLADSLIRKSLDSVKGKIEKAELINAAQKAVNEIYKNADGIAEKDAEGDEAGIDKIVEGTELTVKNLITGKTKQIKLVSEYLFDKKGTKLLIKTTKNAKDTTSKAFVLLYNLLQNKLDTIMKGFGDAKNFAFDEDGIQLSFVAERDSAAKALQKFYKLWYFADSKNWGDTAVAIYDKNAMYIPKNFTISENADVKFSKDGEKIFFGIAPIVTAKDTNLVDFELARLDVWNYKDDYLQPQQLKDLAKELKRNYTVVRDSDNGFIIQLGSDSTENITLMNEGNSNYVLAQSTKGNRVSSQWTGNELNTAYIIYTKDGSRKLITKNANARFRPSPMGKYIFWYDEAKKNYFTYNVATGITKNVTATIKVALYDTENDVPDNPNAAGFTGWIADDKYMLINDEFDIWQVDPDGNELPKNITNGFGRKTKNTFNYVNTDVEKRFIEAEENILLRSFNKVDKNAGFATLKVSEVANPSTLFSDKYAFTIPLKAKDANSFIFNKTCILSSELFSSTDMKTMQQLTNVADQQKEYNWLTAELMHWKMFDGKMSEGILYKPENFDPTKKYPILFYFYERNTDGLYSYKQPSPSASTVNIPYFTSNGYLVFDPNIYYKTGEPGQSAYNSVVSAAKMLSKMPWVDSTRMAIQGQSWGGYQVAYLVTRTNMFRAAGAGAPVSNMTSAYGGIRWGTGLNRQFQYEKSQSRIGATLWQRPDLYIKNSPLFAIDKIKTPLLLMHNDADGAVPWYQGIEMFTAMRRLDKPVWMLQYNGEDHNLVERKNRKDLSIRLAQFFDYWLKDAKPADWIKKGLPATQKGISWGLDVTE
jgi:dipeptidyl aminopeptidase/acylaminoacyl peptidase